MLPSVLLYSHVKINLAKKVPIRARIKKSNSGFQSPEICSGICHSIQKNHRTMLAINGLCRACSLGNAKPVQPVSSFNPPAKTKPYEKDTAINPTSCNSPLTWSGSEIATKPSWFVIGILTNLMTGANRSANRYHLT